MASIGVRRVFCAPSNSVSAPVVGFTAGLAAVTFPAQGGSRTTPMIVSGTIAVDPSGALRLAFVVPDGLRTDIATVTDAASASASLAVNVGSQYLQADEYLGEGADIDPVTVSSLRPGELDVVLRRASTAVDSYLGETVRVMQYVERHRFGRPTGRAPKFFPYHRPVRSLDAISYVASNQLSSTFRPSDVYLNADLGYVEVLAAAFGTYALLTAIESVGFSAQVVMLTVTAGYPDLETPSAIREATAILATEFLNRRRKNVAGLGGLVKIEDKLLENDGQPFAVPAVAKDMLRPFVRRSVR